MQRPGERDGHPDQDGEPGQSQRRVDAGQEQGHPRHAVARRDELGEEGDVEHPGLGVQDVAEDAAAEALQPPGRGAGRSPEAEA